MKCEKSRLRPSLAGVGALALLLSIATPVHPKDLPENLRPAVDAGVARVKPALVRIQVVSTSYADGREIKSQAVGSGAIISKEGHVISNHHVAGRAVRIVCTLADREEVPAELIGTDPLTDICVIRLKPAKPREFPVATFGDSAALQVGDPVLAMGSPMALSQSVTLGIVSNVEMIMPRFFGPLIRLKQEGEDVGSLVRWIGHDAQIYGGNSGGPLVNLRGEIVGINEISLGLGGAIPGNLAHRVADLLIKEGTARRAWLGIEIQPLLKESPDDRGVVVSSVLEHSPAQRAGLQAGDVLLMLGDTPVRVRFEEEIPAFMGLASDLPLGKEISVTVLRDGAEKTFRLTPTEREEARPRQQELKSWGITARNLSSLIALELRRPNSDGVLVTSVAAGGPAGESKPALQPQDVIVQVNDTAIRSLRKLEELTHHLTEGRTEPVPVLATFERKDRRHVTVIKLGLRELKDPGLESTKAWLPIETQVISRDIARLVGKPELKGYFVSRVYPASTAAKAGLKAGDFLVAVDDEKMEADAPEHEDDLATLIRQYDPGTVVKLTVIRDRQQKIVIPVELARSPRLQREMKKYRNDAFEFVTRDVAFQDRTEFRWPDEQAGVLVEDVTSGSWAELGQLYTDDLIVEAQHRPTRNVDELHAVMDQVSAEKPAVVVMKVLRGVSTKFVEIEPQWKR